MRQRLVNVLLMVCVCCIRECKVPQKFTHINKMQVMRCNFEKCKTKLDITLAFLFVCFICFIRVLNSLRVKNRWKSSEVLFSLKMSVLAQKSPIII